jgi:hypothetical protein
VVGEPDEVAGRVLQRYGDIFTRLHLYLKAPLDDRTMHTIVSDLKAG